MKKNLLSSIFVFGLILIGLFLLADRQLEPKVAAAAGHESHGPLTHETTINPELRAFERYLAEPAAVNKAGIVYAMDPVDLKLFNAADTSLTAVTVNKAGIVYAMDPVDLKLFNAADTSLTTVTANKAGIVYAMDSVDLKLFNAAYTSPTTVTADQARWDALGEFYTSNAGVRSAEVITADQARWDALGELYTGRAGPRSAEVITATRSAGTPWASTMLPTI